jgi:hypothetical protein
MISLVEMQGAMRGIAEERKEGGREEGRGEVAQEFVSSTDYLKDYLSFVRRLHGSMGSMFVVFTLLACSYRYSSSSTTQAGLWLQYGR